MNETDRSELATHLRLVSISAQMAAQAVELYKHGHADVETIRDYVDATQRALYRAQKFFQWT